MDTGGARSRATVAANGVMLPALAVAAAGGVWALSGRYVTRQAPRLYEFLPAPVWVFVLALGVALVALLMIDVALRRMADPGRSTAGARARYAHAAPLSLLALLILPPVLPRLSSAPVIVLVYLLADLRWWLAGVVAAWFVWTTVVRLVPRVSPLRWKIPRWAAYVSLGAAALGFVAASSPDRRFNSMVVGDEPRYLRYAESFYQGHGFDISVKAPFGAFTRGSADRRSQLAALGAGLGSAFAGVGRDAWLWVRGDYVTWQPEELSANSFVRGRDGGVYQLHMPGLAFVLYPGYYIDRQFLSLDPDDDDELPRVLVCTGLILVSIYVLFGLATFRLVARYTGSDASAWGLSLLMLVTIPVAPFSLLYYPEIAAGLILVVLFHAVLFETAGVVLAGALGLLAGFLPWLHLRFLPLAVIGVVAHAWRLRRRPASLAAFSIGCGTCFVLLGFYSYHVTGSILPTAIYALSTHGRVDLPGLPNGIAGLLLDRRFGVLPFAPVFVLALSGLRPFLVERRRETWVLALAASILVAMSASHVPWTGAASPARFLVAVMPFALLPLAHGIDRNRASSWFRVTLVLLVVVSIDNAFVYVSHMADRNMLMVDDSVSGWKTTLMFPRFGGRGRGDVWPRAAQVWFWCVCLVALTLVSWRRPTRAGDVAEARVSPWIYCLQAVAIVLATATLGGVLTQSTTGFDPRLRARPERVTPGGPQPPGDGRAPPPAP